MKAIEVAVGRVDTEVVEAERMSPTKDSEELELVGVESEPVER